MKRIISLCLVVLMCVFVLAACSAPPAPVAEPKPAEQPAEPKAEEPAKAAEPAPAAEAPKSNVTLAVMTNMVGESNDAFAQVCNDFTAQTGIAIDYSAPGNDYEPLMRTKMATNDLPDVFSTHGWSVVRYSSFLRPLNDQAWFPDISDFIKPMISDDSGKVYVLPVDMDIAGIVYNRDMLAECGVNVDDIKTWADFEAACDKVKAKGYIPVYFGGREDWTIGQFFDWVAPSFYITNENNNDREALKNGTFDWSKWSAIADMFAKWNKAGYLNKDAATSDYLTCTSELGNGKVAFEFFGNYAVVDANKAGPANIGMMPIPAATADDAPTLIAGERLAVGVWKDSPHMDEAMQFLNYLATPAVITKLATANGMPAGIKGVPSDTGAVTQDYEKYADVRTFPYFDRVYLPGGMWNDFCATGLGILNGSMKTKEICDYMKNSYLEKFQQDQ